MKKPGQFKKQKEKHKLRQKVFDACQAARAGEDDVWITVHLSPEAREDARQRRESGFVRAKLKPVDPSTLKEEDYASCYGFGAILNFNGEPCFIYLSGKDYMVYLDGIANLPTNVFLKKCLALVEEAHTR